MKPKFVKILFLCADQYQKNLENRNLLLICANNGMNKIIAVETLFEPKNFAFDGCEISGREAIVARYFLYIVFDKVFVVEFELATIKDINLFVFAPYSPFSVIGRMVNKKTGICASHNALLYAVIYIGRKVYQPSILKQ